MKHLYSQYISSEKSASIPSNLALLISIFFTIPLVRMKLTKIITIHSKKSLNLNHKAWYQ